MKKVIHEIISVIVILIFLFQTSMVFATSTTELNSEKEENNKEIKQQQQDLKNVQAAKSKTVTEIEQISDQINTYETEIEELNGKITTLSGQIKKSEEEIKKAKKEYDEQQELLNERLVTMYENGETTYLDFVLSSESLADVLSNYFLVSELASYDTELLEKIEAQKNKIEEEKKKLETSQNELTTTKSTKSAKQTQLKSAKAKKNEYVQELSEDEKEIEKKIEQLQQDNKAIDAKIRAAQAAIEKARKQRNSSNSSGSSSGGKNPSGFIRPVKGYSVTTGMYYSSGRYHGAVDFSGSGISGKPVYAVADGYVVTTQALRTSYGNYVIIAHYNGLYTVYAHGQAGSISVHAGQTVTQGQQIMRVGSTGNSTGPHLHFEVRKSPGTYSNRVNPMSYLP